MLDDYKQTQVISYNILKNSINNQKLSHAYLIETNGNSDGFNFALSFAKALLCPHSYTNCSTCNNCNQCKVIDNNNFIELEIIETGEMWITKDKISKLQNDFNFKPVIGHKKIYIIKEADKIRETLANTLLKFIEEPEEGIIAILITENRDKIINTILSRCQIISLNKNDNSNIKIDEMYDFEKVDNAVKFVNFLEKNGLETLLNTIELFHSNYSDRKEYQVAFNIILLYYKDVLNYLIDSDIILFKDYIDKINVIATKNNIDMILKKIDIIINLKNYIKNNINLNLIVDKLIISIEKVKYDRGC